MSVACEIRDEPVVPYLQLPVAHVLDLGEPRPLRLAVPLMLAAGWGALLTFSVMFLMEDGRNPAAVAERGPAAERPEPAQVKEAQAHLQEPAQAAAVEPAAAAAPSVVQVASTAGEAQPAATPTAASVAAPPIVAPRPQGAPIERVGYVGTWGPNAQACGSRSRRSGYIPATITEEGARAGRTLCRFRNGRRDGVAWTVSADCSDRGRNWTSQVRLLVDGDRLIWTSSKGSSSYVRCGRREG
ncbi:hypothetical protein [Methylobacterium gnaphalii]|uniref:Peptidase inhibitor family I36 protein n=1 Tax=Methylobacterium gnaphalii TaxID=1010610 RepID=A0A512JEI7_9HYPH|nr:hypothetical protein [Methylobacterium gnaphalii]GEP08350.1 hypothetical protein MGN01_01950 [Methylobacterium gnaphalii]GJD67874.1 hypothetical protein MMMDOFMJ_0791 [Methylobacterium gnaphalii]